MVANLVPDLMAVLDVTRPRAWPPFRLVSAAALVAILVAVASLTLALRQPELGVRFRRGPTPASAPTLRTLQSIGAVVRISGTHGDSLMLRSDDLEREPDIPFRSYSAFNRFLWRQDRLAHIIRSGSVVLHSDADIEFEVSPRMHRMLSSLPFLFWYQLLAGAGCWICGACILIFRPHDRAAPYAALSGLALMIGVAAAAVFSTRELALPGATFRALSIVNHSGALLASGAFIAVFWHYPRRLTRIDAGPAAIALFALIAVLDGLQILPLGNYGIQLALLAGGAGGGGLALLQWRINRGDPVQCASLQWFLMAWCVGFGVYLSAVTIPALIGIDNGDFAGYAFGGCTLIAAGLALGIARYRLFEVGTWWFRVALFLLGGGALIFVDVMLTEILRFENEEAALISVGLIGWTYFPLRQWLHGKIYTRMGRTHIGDLPALLQAALGREPESTDRLIPDALRRLYAPLIVSPLGSQPGTVTVVDNGMALQVPGIADLPAWEARWPDHGRRLFSIADVRTMTAVRDVMEKIAVHHYAVRQGEERERARLTQDLHDDIGARLLTMLHRYPGAVERDLRDVLERLRATVHGLDARPMPLSQCLDEWSAEAVERCHAAGMELVWKQSDTVPYFVPGTTTQIDLARVLREALSNAFAHAHATRIAITVEVSDGSLGVVVENDGVAANATLRPGLGLRNMEARINRLGGTCQVALTPPHGRSAWHVPLAPE